MSLKILKQQLKDIVEEEVSEVPKTKHHRNRKPVKEEKFTRTRKVMKKNKKPRAQLEKVEDSVYRIKEEVAEARERADENLKWNMQIIDAVSTVNGTDIMNRYLKQKGLISDSDVKEKPKDVSAKSYRIKSKAKKDTTPSSFQWIS